MDRGNTWWGERESRTNFRGSADQRTTPKRLDFVPEKRLLLWRNNPTEADPMTNTSSFLRISRFPLLAGAAMLSVASAGQLAAQVTAAPQAAVSAAAPAASAFDGPEFWYSQNVEAARLSSMTGTLLVVGFIDDACSTDCSRTLKSMKAIERETDNAVHFVIVSDAATRGTPATLAAFAKANKLSANRYTIISSTDAAIAKLAAALDARRQGATPAQFVSSSTLSVLDYNGVLVQQRGYGVIGPVLESVTLLANMR